MFSLQGVSKSFGPQIILQEADWQAPHHGVVGLVGPNGAGKTTLLRILSGEEDYEAGEIATPRDMTLGYLPQELHASDASGSALDVILDGLSELLQLEAEMAGTQALLDDGDTSVVDEHAANLDRYESLGGWSFRARARQIASGLGFRDEDLDKPIGTFSGGWQMRALLGRLLLQKPDVLLLDEPTNHLDMESLEWLEEFLARYEGLVLVVSHDRWFLNRVATDIAELQGGRMTAYPGNWDAYRERKAMRIEQLEAEKSRQDREIARIQQFIERFRYKATKAKQAQSRAKQLDKIERIEVPTEEIRDIQFRFPQPPRGPKIVANMKGVAKSYDDNVVWKGLDFQIMRKDKIALMGPNGAGKTTLLRVLAGDLEFDAGEVTIGSQVDVAYFAQHAVDQLEPSRTVLEEMLAAADHDTAPRARTILGALGFSGTDHDKPVSVLSGGEKNRLALAKMMLEPAGLLLLDEPTNHLDVASRQVLEYALNDYDGAYVLVSHDRYFVNEVAERVVHLEDGEATTYLGDYEYYKWKRHEELETQRAQDEAEQIDSTNPNSKKDARRAAAELRAKKKAATQGLKKRLDTLETSIADLESAIEECEAALQDPSLYADEGKAQQWNSKYAESKAALENAMEEWMMVGAEIEEIEARLDAEG